MGYGMGGYGQYSPFGGQGTQNQYNPSGGAWNPYLGGGAQGGAQSPQAPQSYGGGRYDRQPWQQGWGSQMRQYQPGQQGQPQQQGQGQDQAGNFGAPPSETVGGAGSKIQTTYNYNFQQQSPPQGQGQQQPGQDQPPQPQQPPPFAPVDPFAQTELGQILRGISSGYERSPGGQGRTVGNYIPYGGPQQPGQQQRGQFPGQQQGQGQGQQQQQGPAQPGSYGEYLAPVNPLEHSFRSMMVRRLFGNMYGSMMGPGSSLQNRWDSNRGRSPGAATHIPAMYPEMYDPYKGLFMFQGGRWSPQHGGY